MKKSIIPLSLLVTVIVCCFLTPSVSVFRSFQEKSFSISHPITGGCEISVKSQKGLVKKYFTAAINSACCLNYYDFDGDGENEVCVTDDKVYEIIDFSKDIPLRISEYEDFAPISMRFTKNENSVTGFIDNGQSFELFPENDGNSLTLSPDAEISFTDYDNNHIYEICITQQINDSSGKQLYTVNTFRIFNGRNFEPEKIKITAVG